MSTAQTLFPPCPDCEKPMKLVRTIPKLGGLCALVVFYCAPCNHVETKEQEQAA